MMMTEITCKKSNLHTFYPTCLYYLAVACVERESKDNAITETSMIGCFYKSAPLTAKSVCTHKDTVRIRKMANPLGNVITVPVG